MSSAEAEAARELRDAQSENPSELPQPAAAAETDGGGFGAPGGFAAGDGVAAAGAPGIDSGFGDGDGEAGSDDGGEEDEDVDDEEEDDFADEALDQVGSAGPFAAGSRHRNVTGVAAGGAGFGGDGGIGGSGFSGPGFDSSLYSENAAEMLELYAEADEDDDDEDDADEDRRGGEGGDARVLVDASDSGRFSACVRVVLAVLGGAARYGFVVSLLLAACARVSLLSLAYFAVLVGPALKVHARGPLRGACARLYSAALRCDVRRLREREI